MTDAYEITDLPAFLDALGKSLAPVFEEKAKMRAEHNPAALERLAAAGITLSHIGGNCPVQAEGYVDGEEFYFRARGDAWALEIGPKDEWFTSKVWRYEQPYGEGPFDAGWMHEHEALGFIVEAVERYRTEKCALIKPNEELKKKCDNFCVFAVAWRTSFPEIHSVRSRCARCDKWIDVSPDRKLGERG